MAKLTTDHLEALANLKDDTIAFTAVLILIEQYVEMQENAIVSMHLTHETRNELIMRKARAEGARKILNDVKGHFNVKSSKTASN